ncbi:hypothetical protein [Streptomyces griseochromogenes]|uniref:hypothetical protein n=1 Tax=Streptomyces griseochromogenes TaxID=68214 RepID=UPI00379782C5
MGSIGAAPPEKRGLRRAAPAYGTDAPVSGPYTQELLGWSPTRPTLLDDLEHGDYLATSFPEPPHTRAAERT